jgi:hypothetical protein
MLDRKKELERERHHLIQTNIFFSSEYEEHSNKLTDLVSEVSSLEGVSFLGFTAQFYKQTKILGFAILSNVN